MRFCPETTSSVVGCALETTMAALLIAIMILGIYALYRFVKGVGDNFPG